MKTQNESCACLENRVRSPGGRSVTDAFRQLNNQPQEFNNMTVTQYIRQWLRSRSQRPAALNAKTLGKKDRQILPTLPKAKAIRASSPATTSAAAYRVL